MLHVYIILIIIHVVSSKSVNAEIQYGKEIDVFKTELEELKSQMKHLTEAVQKEHNTKHVFFFVRLTPATTLNKNSILKFDQVITDSGNNFNSGDGIFVAPVAGYYQFSWTTFTYSSKAQETELRVDNKQIDGMYGHIATSSHVPATKVVICKVEKGDHVWIQTTNVYTDNTFAIPYNSRSSFTGLLVQET